MSQQRSSRHLARLFDTTDPKLCPLCGALAVVPLPPFLLAQQPDNTTHVCLPVAPFNGCNTGFGPTD
ncbi:MAG TPA: hypothetical protein VJS69_01265 [Candidatus Krumholzibacteria bacterium]|nr:hypothetical protein [Candidatus Krumholzibacteria bacterium]